MKFFLKDKEHQAALEKALPGFTTELQCACEVQFSDPARSVQVDSDWWSLTIEKEYIEVVTEFEPEKWNNWPGTEPPEDVLMRVEIFSPEEGTDTPEPRGGDLITRCCGIFTRGKWVFYCGVELHDGETVRYRLWK